MIQSRLRHGASQVRLQTFHQTEGALSGTAGGRRCQDKPDQLGHLRQHVTQSVHQARCLRHRCGVMSHVTQHPDVEDQAVLVQAIELRGALSFLQIAGQRSLHPLEHHVITRAEPVLEAGSQVVQGGVVLLPMLLLWCGRLVVITASQLPRLPDRTAEARRVQLERLGASSAVRPELGELVFSPLGERGLSDQPHLLQHCAHREVCFEWQ